MKKQELNRLSLLARISVSRQEADTLLGKIEPVLEYVGELQIHSATGDRPSEPELPEHYNITRADRAVLCDPDTRAEIIAAFPDRKDNYLRVKQIIDQSNKETTD